MLQEFNQDGNLPEGIHLATREAVRYCSGERIMITTDEQFEIAQECVRNLRRILLAARKIHHQDEYRLMAEPILTELQWR